MRFRSVWVEMLRYITSATIGGTQLNLGCWYDFIMLKLRRKQQNLCSFNPRIHPDLLRRFLQASHLWFLPEELRHASMKYAGNSTRCWEGVVTSQSRIKCVHRVLTFGSKPSRCDKNRVYCRVSWPASKCRVDLQEILSSHSPKNLILPCCFRSLCYAKLTRC